MGRTKKTQRNNSYNPEENLKYLSRCQYYGTLEDCEYPEVGGLILKFKVFTATSFYAVNVTIRIYVPTEMEDDVHYQMEIGERYWVLCSPYTIRLGKSYPHRVDLLLNFGKIAI